MPAAVPDRDDTALRATADGFAGLDAQNQTVLVAVTELTWMPPRHRAGHPRACTSARRNKT
jgi:hypothetical protein